MPVILRAESWAFEMIRPLMSIPTAITGGLRKYETKADLHSAVRPSCSL